MTTWVTTTDRGGRRAYVTRAGSIVSKDGCGRTPVTVLYPGHAWNDVDADYGMVDTIKEGKAWAELAEREQEKDALDQVARTARTPQTLGQGVLDREADNATAARARELVATGVARWVYDPQVDSVVALVRAGHPDRAYLVCYLTTGSLTLDDFEVSEDWPAWCEWFAGCDREVVATQDHPILGTVPVCARCKEFASN